MFEIFYYLLASVYIGFLIVHLLFLYFYIYLFLHLKVLFRKQY